MIELNRKFFAWELDTSVQLMVDCVLICASKQDII